MEKEIKIEIPEGYEIDKEKSTFERIVFKKKKPIVNCWNDIEQINGVFINIFSTISECTEGPNTPLHYNVFLNEKYAKSALAMAQISQLLPYYNTSVNWDSHTEKFYIHRKGNNIIINVSYSMYHLLAFNTREEAERFLKYNEQLVKDYLMIS